MTFILPPLPKRMASIGAQKKIVTASKYSMLLSIVLGLEVLCDKPQNIELCTKGT